MTIEQMTPEEEVRLRLAAGISPSTPTEYMLKHIPLWVRMSILRSNSGGGGTTESVTTYDFTTNTYRKNGSTVSLGAVSEFIRLSSATEWQGGQLVEVTDNTPRISGEGLLVEPQRTNLFPNTLMTTGVEVIPTTLEVGEGNVVPAVRFPHGAVPYSYVTLSCPNPCVISAYVKNADSSKPEFVTTGEGVRAGGDFAFVVSADALHPSGYTVSKHGDVYRVSGLSELPEGQGNTGIVKYATNSPRDVTATYRQVEAGDTLTSLIKSYGSPTTRSPDILNIPLLPTQTITGDWDAGVTYSVAGGIATFTGHGYIRNITVETL